MTQLIDTQSRKAANLTDRFRAVRAFASKLCETLSPEDCCLQSMPDASPIRWHLAHTTWFFETFVLKQDPSYRLFNDHYEVLFNSYYNSVGEQFPRAQRGLLSRPSLDEVMAYRQHVDDRLVEMIEQAGSDLGDGGADVIELGLHHEQQHQELMLTDVKHLFSLNPLLPTYRNGQQRSDRPTSENGGWFDIDEGVYVIGHAGDGFAYDNEGPQHRVFLEPCRIANRPVTSGEFLAFIEDGGYARPELWLSLGWNQVQASGWVRPFYWRQRDGQWHEFTLAGLRPLDLAAPVSHVSYFEADAYARWAGARLPTEAEWEVAAEDVLLAGNFADTLLAKNLALHPCSASTAGDEPAHMFGDVWEWTASPYTPYPGYQTAPGALGEYNGKFMCNQYVLRGGSIATSSSHIRRTYRNFFPPEARWQISGFRLAR